MIPATMLPVFFVVIQWLSELRSGPPQVHVDPMKLPTPDEANGEPQQVATRPTVS